LEETDLALGRVLRYRKSFSSTTARGEMVCAKGLPGPRCRQPQPRWASKDRRLRPSVLIARAALMSVLWRLARRPSRTPETDFCPAFDKQQWHWRLWRRRSETETRWLVSSTGILILTSRRLAGSICLEAVIDCSDDTRSCSSRWTTKLVRASRPSSSRTPGG